MDERDAILEVLGDRAVLATAMLCDAVRLDFGQFLGTAVEGRLRSRPNFLARMPRAALIELRERLQRELNHLIAASERPVHELRARLLEEPVSRDEETALLADALGTLLVERTRELLVEHRFPGDDVPDLPDKPMAPLRPEFHLGYAPSTVVLWAWRQVRALDQATRQLESSEGRPLATFEIRYYLPEALPTDRLK